MPTAQLTEDFVSPALDESAIRFYREVLQLLHDRKLDYLVGGAYAFARYTGVERHTKDLDLFMRRSDFDAVAAALREAGLRTELTHPHWIGKAFSADLFVDLIFGGGNGEATVDDLWFRHAVDSSLFGVPVRLCPVEEIIWSKSWVMERERFDGADVNHLILRQGKELDWDRLVLRFGKHWRVLLFHLIAFGFSYPSERDVVPRAVLETLVSRLTRESQDDAGGDRVCNGTLLSRAQYLVDIDQWNYHDGRVEPRGRMTEKEVEHWTAAIDER
jgi:hypothetical protein